MLGRLYDDDDLLVSPDVQVFQCAPDYFIPFHNTPCGGGNQLVPGPVMPNRPSLTRQCGLLVHAFLFGWCGISHDHRLDIRFLWFLAAQITNYRSTSLFQD